MLGSGRVVQGQCCRQSYKGSVIDRHIKLVLCPQAVLVLQHIGNTTLPLLPVLTHLSCFVPSHFHYFEVLSIVLTSSFIFILFCSLWLESSLWLIMGYVHPPSCTDGLSVIIHSLTGSYAMTAFAYAWLIRIPTPFSCLVPHG